MRCVTFMLNLINKISHFVNLTRYLYSRQECVGGEQVGIYLFVFEVRLCIGHKYWRVSASLPPVPVSLRRCFRRLSRSWGHVPHAEIKGLKIILKQQVHRVKIILVKRGATLHLRQIPSGGDKAGKRSRCVQDTFFIYAHLVAV